MKVVAFSPTNSGRHLLVTCNDDWAAPGVVRIWDLDELEGPNQPLENASMKALRPKFSLYGHQSGINVACFTPDGHWLVTAGDDETVRIWNLDFRTAPRESIVLRGHDGPVTVMSMSVDGQWLATAAGAHSEVVANAEAAHESDRLPLFGIRPGTPSFYDCDVRLWNLAELLNESLSGPLVEANECLLAATWPRDEKHIVGLTSHVTDMDIEGMPRKLMRANDDREVRIWNSSGDASDPVAIRIGAQGNWANLRSIVEVRRLEVDSQMQWLFVQETARDLGGLAGTFYLPTTPTPHFPEPQNQVTPYPLDPKTPEPDLTTPASSPYPAPASDEMDANVGPATDEDSAYPAPNLLSPTRMSDATASRVDARSDSSAKPSQLDLSRSYLVDLRSRDRAIMLPIHTEIGVSDLVKFLPGSEQFVVVSVQDGTLYRWKLATSPYPSGSLGEPHKIAVSQYSRTYEPVPNDPSEPTLADPPPVLPQPPRLTELSDDGRWLFGAYEDGVIRIWDLQPIEPQLIKEFTACAGPLRRMVLSEEGGKLAVISGARDVYIWEVAMDRGRPVSSKTVRATADDVKLSTDGQWLLVSKHSERQEGNSTELWNLLESSVTSIPTAPPRRLSSPRATNSTVTQLDDFRFSADGHWLLQWSPGPLRLHRLSGRQSEWDNAIEVRGLDHTAASPGRTLSIMPQTAGCQLGSSRLFVGMSNLQDFGCGNH